MRGRRSDQGGRWPAGAWLALVGLSAGTVASFSLVGWTFTQGLYFGDDSAEPLQIDSGSVVIEGQPTPDPDDQGFAGGDGPVVEPGGDSGLEPASPEPRSEPVTGREEALAPAEEPEEVDGAGELAESSPPRLLPVEEEERPCPPEESAAEDDGPGSDWDFEWETSADWDWDQGGDWNDDQSADQGETWGEDWGAEPGGDWSADELWDGDWNDDGTWPDEWTGDDAAEGEHGETDAEADGDGLWGEEPEPDSGTGPAGSWEPQGP